MPIYLVIYERDQGPQGWQVDGFILAVVSCDLSERDEVWKRLVQPLLDGPRSIYAHSYRREPDSPLREMVVTPEEAEKKIAVDYRSSEAWG